MPTIFTGGYSFSYEKYTSNNGIEKIEYYDQNDKLKGYKTIEGTKEFKITRLYHGNGDLIEESKVFYNLNGIPYSRIKEFCPINEGPYQNTDYRIPMFPGYEDASRMTEEDKKEYSKLINAYLWSNFVEPYLEN